MVRYALEGLDAEIRSPQGVVEAARLCRKVLFDVVIVLTVTPLMGSMGLFPRREAGVRRPVVYVVAWQQSEQAVLSLLEGGVDQYMTLPINLQRLRGKIIGELNSLMP